jgi:hypothetical protein
LPVLSEPFPCGPFSSGSSRGLLFLAVRLSSRPGLSSLVQSCIASRLCGPNPLPFRALRLYFFRAGLLACLRLSVSASLPPWDFSRNRLAFPFLSPHFFSLRLVPVFGPYALDCALPAMESEAKAGSPRKASAQACRRRGAGAAGPGAVEAVCRAHPTRRRAIRRRVMA